MHSAQWPKKSRSFNGIEKMGKCAQEVTTLELRRERLRGWEKIYDDLLQQNHGKAKLRRMLIYGASEIRENVAMLCASFPCEFRFFWWEIFVAYIWNFNAVPG